MRQPDPATGEHVASTRCADGKATCSTELPALALDKLMPLHIIIDADGTIASVGPTLKKLRPVDQLVHRNLLSVFEVRRPHDYKTVRDLLRPVNGRVSLAFRHGIAGNFTGVAVPVGCQGSVLVNLSLGISVVEAVKEYDLTAGDFAGTDLAVEMLYLVEAKSAALNESKKLNIRLQGAKVAAEEQAFTDTLTGLKNRRAMEHIFGRLVSRGVPFGLMQLDLDFFKRVNDTHGHTAGDEVLQTVSRILVSETRSSDTVVRVGGDEFLLIFPDLTDVETLRDLGERIIARLEEPVVYNNATCRISGSIGLTISGVRGGQDASTVLERADAALYESKRLGRGRLTARV